MHQWAITTAALTQKLTDGNRMNRWLLLGASILSVVLLGGTLFYVTRSPAPLVDDTSTVPVVRDEPVRFLLVGDIMFDRYIRKRAEDIGYAAIIEGVAPLLRAHDAVIGNLEGPVVPYRSVSKDTVSGEPNNMRFVFAHTLPSLLAEFNFAAVSIGNNHIRDFGDEGLITTRIFLSEAGLRYFGDPIEPAKSETLSIGGRTVSFIAYNQFMGQGLPETVAAIESAASTSDVVVVFPHWGEEYEPAPTQKQRELAHAFIDAGADLVAGAHSHVIGETEIYRGKRIYYSLGNFVFDQYFSPETMQRLALSVTVDASGELLFTEHFVDLLKDGTTVLTPTSS